MRLELLEDLYKQKLAEIYDAEKQLVRFLPKMAQAIPNPEWRRLLEKHLEETQVQCQRLEQLMTKRGVQELRKAKAMSGILAESKDLLQQRSSDPQVLALALASAAQDVEGHEITCYACAHTYARLLGFHDDLRPLEETFQEEKKMEESLATLAESLGVEAVESETEIQPTPSGRA